MKEIWEECTRLGGDVQALSHELHSSILDHLGIASAGENFCLEFSKQHKVKIRFTARGIPTSLSRDISLPLFRILQEGVRNAFKHSGVAHFFVALDGTEREIFLEIRDQGTGFDVEKEKGVRGIGLISMEERVSLLQGNLTISSIKGKGTKIRVSVPLERNEQRQMTRAARG